MVCPVNGELQRRAKREEVIGKDFYDFIRQAAPNCSETFKDCVFSTKEIDCCWLFKPSVTRDGFCFNVNHLPLQEIFKKTIYVPFEEPQFEPNVQFWTPEKGYPDIKHRLSKTGTNVFPIWQSYVHENFGLVMKLFQNVSEGQRICNGELSGFKITIHSPADPVQNSPTFNIQAEEDVRIAVAVAPLKSEDTLRSLKPEIRLCYFEGERKMRFFKLYTEMNCEIECRALYIYNMCGCIPFFLPHDGETRICSRIKDMKCMLRARRQMNTDVQRRQLEMNMITRSACGCYRSCNEIRYTTFYSSVIEEDNLNWQKYKSHHSEKISSVQVYFNKYQFLGQRRLMQYSNLKFASSFGGIFNLFLGLSVISVAEIIYFFLFRPLNRTVIKVIKMSRRARSQDGIIQVATFHAPVMFQGHIHASVMSQEPVDASIKPRGTLHKSSTQPKNYTFFMPNANVLPNLNE